MNEKSQTGERVSSSFSLPDLDLRHIDTIVLPISLLTIFMFMPYQKRMDDTWFVKMPLLPERLFYLTSYKN
jgi:hypothetical protein